MAYEKGDRFLDIDSGRDDEYLSAPTQHYTFVFNVLVMMTLFNEINARKIDGSTNVFHGLNRSRMFIIIWTTSFILQVDNCNELLYSIDGLQGNFRHAAMSTQYRPNGIAYTGYDVLPDEYLIATFVGTLLVCC